MSARRGWRAAALLSILFTKRAIADEDSRDSSQAAQMVTLGRVTLEGGRAIPHGVEATLDEDRRQLHVVVRFEVSATGGAHTLSLSAPPTGVRATFDGKLLDITRVGPCAPVAINASGVDPASGERYPLTAAPPAPCETKSTEVTIGDSGSGELVLRAALDAGYDRLRRRRTLPETAHRQARRVDYLVYHFALTGAGDRVTLHLPPATDGVAIVEKSIIDPATIRVAASEQRRLPLGIQISAGVVLVPDVRFTARLTLDALLPWGDTLVLGIDGDSTERASLSLGYALHTRWAPLVPFGAHVELGPVVDLTPDARIGVRLAVGSHFNWSQTTLIADVFPVDKTWRLALVTGLGF